MTVRLSKSDGVGGFVPNDDLLEIEWDDSAFSWPLAAGTLALPQDVTIGGAFTLEGIFSGGDTTGYGEPGAVETLAGNGISMTSAAFAISDFSAPCPDGPQLTTNPNSPVAVSSAGARYGVLNPFSQNVRGTLSLRMTFQSSVAANCGAAPSLTPAVDNSVAPAMPVRFDGAFKVSPGITPDGKMRFGKLTVDDSLTPQLSTFAFVRACTTASTCVPEQFPARLKFKRLTAEVILGDIFPG
jgi:hypothetical protein